MGNVQIVNFDLSNFLSQSEFGTNACGLSRKRKKCVQTNSSARQKAKCAITKTTLDTTENHRDNTCLVVFYNQAISVRVLLFTCN